MRFSCESKYIKTNDNKKVLVYLLSQTHEIHKNLIISNLQKVRFHKYYDVKITKH